MANVKSMYSGQYMTADDLPDTPVTHEVLAGSIDKKIGRVTLSLRDTGKRLALNKVNANAIAAKLGWDTDNWIGSMIVIHKETVQYMGDPVDGIRIVSVTKPSENGQSQ